jgi:hypothetical protein
MDTGTIAIYGLLCVLAVGAGVGLRFIVYTMLVKNGQWLPEKAKSVATISSITIACVLILLIVGNGFLSMQHH